MNNPPSSLTKDLSRLDWKEFHGWAALLCLPAMAVALIAGVAAHLPPAGIVAAGGTLTAGFASFRRLQGSRLLPMLLTAAGMFAAATLGTLLGQSHSGTVLLAGLLGLLYGLVLVVSEDGSWVGLQCTIAYLVASAFPSEGWHALLRGALVSAGGAAQAFLLPALGRVKLTALQEDMARCDPRRVAKILWHDLRPLLWRNLHAGRTEVRYAMRVGVTLMLAVAGSFALHQINSYWLPMTTLIVMKPDFYRTYTSVLGRVFGTFAGVGVASLLTHVLHPSVAVLVVLILLFAWGAFAWQKVNYALFSCSLTAWMVFLVALAGLPETATTANRLLDTALGCLLALGSRAVGPRWDKVSVNQELGAPGAKTTADVLRV